MVSSVEVYVCVSVVACVTMFVRGDQARDAVQRTRLAVERTRMQCTKAQSNIDFIELLGLWNVIELIEHSDRYMDDRNYLRAVSRSNSCPVVHFAVEDDREVRMLWHEERGYIQFKFRMTNINNPGFWMSLPYQTGTMVDSHYKHFSGTVQVMKAVQSHMVLTFCSPTERHYSIILARSKHLNYDEIQGVHNQLDRANLPRVAVKSYCRNAGVSTSPSALLAALLVVVLSVTHL